MAFTTHTMTGNVRTMFGEAIAIGSVRGWAETNLAPTERMVFDLDNNIQRLGTGKFTIDAEGAWELSEIPAWENTEADQNPTGVQIQVVFEYTDPATRTKKLWRSGYLQVDHDGDIGTFVEQQLAPADWRSDFMDQAEGLLAAQVDVSNIEVSDDVVEALVKNTGGAGPKTSAALTTSTAQSIEPGETDPQAAVDARAARLGGPRTNKIVLLGNSRLERDYSNNGTSVYNSAKGIFTWANARLGGRFDVVKYAGVSGETLAEMADRFADDVAVYSPAWVLLADAVNDATNNRTTAEMIADTETIIDLCRSIGARPIILTAPPNNSHSSGQRSALLGWNRWVKQYPDPFVVPVDVAEPVTDAAGAYSTWYAEDGLHQSRAGAMRMGRVLAESLAPIVPPLDPFPSSPLDPTIFTLNPWMNGVSGSGVAANWTSSGTATFTKVVRNEGQATVWNEIEKTATGTVFLQQTRSPAPAGMVAGVRVRLLFEMEIDDASTLGDLSAQVQLRNSSSSPIVTLAALAAWGTTTALGDLPTGEPIVLSSPVVELPSGFHNFNFFLSFIGLGTVRVGRVAIVQVD